MPSTMLVAKPNLVSCNFPTLITPNSKTTSLHPQNQNPPQRKRLSLRTSQCCFKIKPLDSKTNSPFPPSRKTALLHVCHTSKKDTQIEPVQGRDWTTSIFLFFLWAALVYYVSFLSPNQTPTRDLYFLKKLLNLKGDDGFRMNEVLVSMWYIMGLWPVAYSMLLLPTGRSSKSKIPVWPFLSLSFFGGVYALLPYFVLWKPPAPPVEESQLKSWPLNFLESKVTAIISLAAGIGLITYAGLSGEEVWKEFYQYFRESKFIHIMTIDFTLLSTLAPFWVYNDMTARKWFDKGSWLLPVSLIPFLGPGLYLLLRPSLSSTMAISQTPVEPE